MPILTKDAVTLHDIQTNDIWDQMSHAHAEGDLQCARNTGDTIQEYETTDRAGNPLRIALVIETRMYGDPDMGGVYEFATV
jgi:hypothetical protein